MGSGIATSEGPMYLGRCEYCDKEIYSDEEHYELPDDTLYCSEDCLIAYYDAYHYWGVTD